MKPNFPSSSGTLPVIALTGATGFLGSHLMAGLLKQGNRVVVLGRAAQDTTLRQRITQLLRWLGLETCSENVETMEVDFGAPRFGLSKVAYSGLCAVTDQIIHCASDTNFSERHRERVFAANVGCLEGILELACRSRASFLHYVSTAYATGITHGICAELPANGGTYANAYEESKAEAERIITASCHGNGIPLTILRPSVVYGDSRTGRGLKFNAVYHPVKSLAAIRDIYLHDIRENGGYMAQGCGIVLTRDGRLRLPLRIHVPEPGAINLVPVDYFVAAALSIWRGNPTPGIYHLTSDTPVPLETLARYAERFLDVVGLEVVDGKAEAGTLRNPAEELFDHYLEPYRPYLADWRVFSRANADAATNGLTPPEFTYEIFRRCMDYAVASRWGKGLFEGHFVAEKRREA